MPNPQRYLFSVGLNFASELDTGDVSEQLRSEFQGHGLELADHVQVKVEQSGSKWMIVDAGRHYLIRSENQTLNVYSPRTIRVLVAQSNRTDEKMLLRTLNTGAPQYLPDGYILNVQATQLVNPDAAQHLTRCVREYRSHVVVLEDALITHTRESLHAWNDCLKPAECLLLTRSQMSTRRAMFASLERVVPVAGKDLSKDADIKAIIECIYDVYNQAYQGGLEIIGNEKILGETEFHRDEIEELLERLFPHEHQLSVNLLQWNTLCNEESAGQSLIRPRSILLEVRLKDRVPVVVKIARRERIKLEIERYYKHIEGRLVGLRHTHILRYATVWNTGGIIYSLIGASARKTPETLSGNNVEESLQTDTKYNGQPQPFARWIVDYAGDEERNLQLAKTIQDLYSSVLSLLHSTTISYPDRIPSLFEQYNAVWTKRDEKEKWEEELSGLLKPGDTYWQPPLRHFIGIPIPLPNPVYWVWQNRLKSLLLDVTLRSNAHGDMHSGNVLVDGSGYCWLLDYERSGPGPALQDYVEMEIDLLTCLAGYDGNLRLVCAVALIIVEFIDPKKPMPTDYQRIFRTLPSSKRAIFLIEALRVSASENTRYTDVREYLWGLLLNTIFILGQAAKHGHSLRAEYAAIVGGIICLRLDYLNSLYSRPRQPLSWPPPELATLLQQVESDND